MFGFYPVASAPIADDQAGVVVPITVSVTGLSATASTAATTIAGAVDTPQTGLGSTGGVGTLTVTGIGNTSATGVAVTGSVGTAVARTLGTLVTGGGSTQAV